MALSLTEYKADINDAWDLWVIDEFRGSSYLFAAMPFDQGATLGNDDTWTYKYKRVTTQASAAVRAVNTDYTAQEQKNTSYSTELKIFGGSAKIDRTQLKTSSIEGIDSFMGRQRTADRLQEQLAAKIKATGALFNHLVINGDDSSSALEFDGLDVALTGSSTERTPSAPIALITAANIASNAKTFAFELEHMLSELDGMPDALLMNRAMKAKMTAIAREVGYLTQSEDAFGRPAMGYQGIPFVDLGDRPASTNPVIATAADTSSYDMTSIYAVRFGMDGFHGVWPSAGAPIETYMERNGVNYMAEAEMVASVALKKTRAAGVLRNIAIAA